MISRAVLTVMTACLVLTIGSALAVYTAVTAFADETWPDF